MTPDERVKAALTDFEEALYDGEDVVTALNLAADDYGLSADVLRIRASSVLGDLDLHQQKMMLRRKNDHEEAQFRSSVEEYVAQHFSTREIRQSPGMTVWLESRLDRPLRETEERRAKRIEREALQNSLLRDLDVWLKEIEE